MSGKLALEVALWAASAGSSLTSVFALAHARLDWWRNLAAASLGTVIPLGLLEGHWPYSAMAGGGVLLLLLSGWWRGKRKRARKLIGEKGRAALARLAARLADRALGHVTEGARA